MKIPIDDSAYRLLTRVSRLLGEMNVRAYAVGGLVRDTLLGRPSADIDIATDIDARKVASDLAAALGGKYIPLDDENQVARIILADEATDHKWELDFSTLRGSIEADLAQRDFTVDAMAMELEKLAAEGNLSPDTVIDPFHGMDDLHHRVVRAVNESGFRSDPARLIRAVRLAAELGFTIDSETETMVRRDSRLMAGVAGERVREELLHLLALPRSGQLLDYMDNLGLLTVLIPELAPARGVSQPVLHVWDVFEHSLKTVTAVEFLLREGTWDMVGEDVLAAVPWSPRLSRHFDQTVSSGSTRRTLLKLAALLHDVAKPQTKTTEENGRTRFLGHPVEGAAITAKILERLRFSTREIKSAELMVKYHLRPAQMSHEGLPTRRAVYRYFRDTGETGIDILFLSLADHLAARGSELDTAQWQAQAELVEHVLNQHFEEAELIKLPKLLDGHDLLKISGLSPGPRIGELLEALREAQAAREVTSREAAEEYIKRLLSEESETPSE